MTAGADDQYQKSVVTKIAGENLILGWRSSVVGVDVGKVLEHPPDEAEKDRSCLAQRCPAPAAAARTVSRVIRQASGPPFW